MKKFLIVTFSVLLCFSLCGCSIKGAYISKTNDYLVSAIGFEESGDIITVFCEAVIINNEDTEADKKAELLEGTGKTLELAFADLYKSAVEVLEFSHCTVAVIDESISAEKFSEITEFLLNLEKLNISVQLISCNNAKDLLTCEAITSLAIGYDIIGMLEKESDITGIKYKNRLYEVVLERQSPLDVAAIPSIKVLHGEYFINGIAVLKSGKLSLKLDREQAATFAIATDTQSNGEIVVNSNKFKIASNLTTVRIEKENPDIIILNVKIDTNEEKKEIKNSINELFNLSKKEKTDIFGFGNILAQRHPEIFNNIKSDYYGYYENTKLKVRFK